MLVLHGTTRRRAEQIVLNGPDPNYSEPGGGLVAGGFSTNAAAGPFHSGHPADSAFGKARQFPDEGGPIILAVDVPDEIVARVANDWFPVEQGLIQFDPGAGLEELRAAWPNLTREIRGVT